MKRRPHTTVQSMFKPNCAMIRLRGKWVTEVFKPGTKLIATKQWQAGKIVLVLEEVPV